MEKARKITNLISWGIVIITGFLLLFNWNSIPESVIVHIGAGISYGSKNTLIVLFIVEIVAEAATIVIQIAAVIILSVFVLLAVML